MAKKPESAAEHMIRFLALGVPTVSRIMAVALVVAAIGIAFFGVGNYPSDDDRAIVALMLAVFALVALGIGFATPAIIRRLLP
ncbi:hypothetical protein [Bauldia litoralis]|nr:hypothetical protein [Bauldia litoralis]